MLLALSLCTAFGTAVGGPARYAIGVLDLLLLAAVIVDWLRTPNPERLRIERSLPRRVGLSQDFVRRLRIQDEVGNAGGLWLELREEFDAHLEVRSRTYMQADEESPTASSKTTEPGAAASSGEALEWSPAAPVAGDPTGGADRVLLPPTGPLDVLREYRAHRRGRRMLGRMRLRLFSPWGLLIRQALISGRSELDVEPPLLGLSTTLRLAASERWRDLGVRRIRRRGGLTEFESLRDYVHGDDVRLVDWKAFARRGRPTVREFQEERGQELWIGVDCGRRMAATAAEGKVGGWTKLDHALDAALQLAAVALQRGDRVGILAFDDRPRAMVAPGRGAQQLERLRHAIFDLRPSRLESDLSETLRQLAVHHPRRALLLILSDVADLWSVEQQARSLTSGNRRHRVLFAALDDPGVRAAAEGRFTEHAPVRAAVRAEAIALQTQRRQALAQLSRSGVHVIDTLPAEAAAPLLAAWLDARRRGA